MTSVTLPNSLTYIGEMAFGFCTSLTDINIPGSVTKIMSGVFRNCSSLKTITIPRSVTVFGENVFGNCASLNIRVFEGSEAYNYVTTNDLVHTVIPSPKINSISHTQVRWADGTAQVTFAIKASISSEYIMMYDENDTLIKTFSAQTEGASYSDSGDVRVWKIKHAFSNDGDRTMIFRASPDGTDRSAAKQYPLTIEGLKINSVSFSPSTVMVGKSVTITARTNLAAKKLRMCTETGAAAKTWDAASYSTVENGVRVWKMTYSFSGAGNRKLTFKTSYDGTNFISTGKTATVTVSDSSVVVSSSQNRLSNGTARVTFNITTDKSAGAVAIYTEDGSLLKKLTSYTTSGSNRVWKLSYDFTNDGNRTFTFKALSSSGSVQDSKKYAFTVKGLKIHSVAFTPNPAAVNSAVTMTIKTNQAAAKLRMYSETGAVVKTWDAASASTVSGNVRIWKVKHTFTGAGNRKLTFKTTYDGTNYIATGTAAALTVSGGAPAVSSAVASTTKLIANKDFVTITAKTTTEAAYLHMLAEDGSIAKTWDAATYSTVSGTTRVWKVKHQFTGGGTRKVKIVASKDKKTTGTGIALTFNVTAPTTVTAGKSYSVSLNDGETKYFLIKPTTSKTYTFYTTGSADTYGTLYRSADGTVVTQNDDTSGLNFSISQYLTAGKSYIIGIKLFSGSGTTTLTVK